eukprot:Skav215661  [mRNA]  locus=scaffold2880:239561:244291:- [translate_table: standard]
MDSRGLLLGDYRAMKSGLRLDLHCIQFDDGCVVGATTSNVFPTMIVRTKFEPGVCKHLSLGDTYSIVDFNLSQEGRQYVAGAKDGPFFPLRHLSNDKSPAGIELFAGLGGWSVGAAACGLQTRLYIEYDQQTADACAKSHGLPCLTVEQALDAFREGCLPEAYVLCADVCDRAVIFLMTVQGASWVLMSPPCQPWSRSGSQLGFRGANGAVFMHAVFNIVLIKASGILAENVPGFPDHQRFRAFVKAVQDLNWRMPLSCQHKVAPLLPIMRARWLTCMLPCTMNVDLNLWMRAKNMNLPNEVPGIGKDNSIGHAGCYQTNIHEWEWQAAVPDEDAMMLLTRYDLLPGNLKAKVSPNASPEQVLLLRTKTSRNLLPNIMAMTGSQHLLPLKHLLEKGLHTFVIQDGDKIRYPMPFEIAMSMSYPVGLVLPTDFKAAWRMVGNGLSGPHAAIMCLKVHVMLGNDSPFQCTWVGPFDLCKHFLNNRIQLDDYEVGCDNEWMFLKTRWSAAQVDMCPSDDEGKSPRDCASVPPTQYDSPSRCRKCISPTWIFESDSDDEQVTCVKPDDYHNWPIEVIRTVAPKCDSLILKLSCPLPEETYGMIADRTIVHKDNKYCAALLHDQGIWGKYVWRDDHETVKTTIRRALPHCIREHMEVVLVDGTECPLMSIPVGACDCEIIFTPRMFERLVISTLLDCPLRVKVDLTWTFHDLLAFAAAEAAVLPSTLQLKTDDEIMNPSQFVLATKQCSFQMEYQIPFVPVENLVFGPKHPKSGLHICDPDIDPPVQVLNDKAYGAHQGFLRFAIRDPKWGSIRTVACKKDETIGAMMNLLLPSFVGDNAPRVMVGDLLVDGTLPVVNLLAFEYIEVHFPTTRPWPNTQLVCIVPFQRLAPERELVKLSVKGPFDNKPAMKSFYYDTTLCEAAAGFIDCFQTNCTMLTLIGGKNVDARTRVQDIADQILHVRVCGLIGGGKAAGKGANADTIQKLADILAQRGVPQDEATTRAKMVISKVAVAELKTVLSKDSTSMWAELKSLANNAKIRLITSAELKVFQKQQRNVKKETKQPSKPTNSNSRRPLDPTKVTVDVAHFRVGDQPVDMLDFSNFGPDAKGLAIATPEQAEKLLPAGRLSADALGLLVLTRAPFAKIEPQMIPALDQKGNPILVSAVLVNYGDQCITCLPRIPSARVDEIATATLEIRVEKDLVSDWAQTRNPMNFLGLMLPEVRSGQVIASWSMKFYTSDRRVVQHDQADYLHGYMRIPMGLLEPTLKRSGVAGVFVQSKTENHRHDPNYGIVPLYGYSLDDANTLAKNTTHVLGVVTMGSSSVYALRGKREHVAAIRRAALPQCIAPQEGQIEAGATWYFIKSLKANTNCEQLTAALKQLGWEASAIKPTGQHTWLVSSREEPPANHLIINDQYVAVVAMGVKGPATKAPAKAWSMAKDAPMLQANFNMCAEDQDDAMTSVGTRLSDMKADLKTSLEDQFAVMLNDRLKGYDEQISTLQATVQAQKAESEAANAAIRADVQTIHQQQSTIQEQMTAQNGTIMTQMNKLFGQMQTSLTTLNTKMEVLENEAKRPRKEGGSEL